MCAFILVTLFCLLSRYLLCWSLISIDPGQATLIGTANNKILYARFSHIRKIQVI